MREMKHDGRRDRRVQRQVRLICFTLTLEKDKRAEMVKMKTEFDHFTQARLTAVQREGCFFCGCFPGKGKVFASGGSIQVKGGL